MEKADGSVASVVRQKVEAWRPAGVSASVHVVAILGLMGLLHGRLHNAPYKLPGTAQGDRLLTFYSPGTTPHAVSEIAEKDTLPKPPSLFAKATVTAPPKKQVGAPAAETGVGSSTESGQGEGDIRIAVQRFFPYPTIDVTTLPHGTHSDVILNAVIGEDGKITELTVVKGLGPVVDDAVIATVKQWTFAPATKNGTPISSEQELHFHYERS
jgi:protein TonB